MTVNTSRMSLSALHISGNPFITARRYGIPLSPLTAKFRPSTGEADRCCHSLLEPKILVNISFGGEFSASVAKGIKRLVAGRIARRALERSPPPHESPG